jgi:murein L,D-transpeptidase YafK
MMTRAWLILADILVHLLLFTSLILLYTFPVSKQRISKEDRMALEALANQDLLIDVNLDERLALLSAKVGDPVFIRIFKEESILEVWIRPGEAYQHLKDYHICAYSGTLGPKLQEGDRQSPEGFYKVKKYQLNPNSKYHLSFNLGFPNAYDRAHERTGSFLMVHGNCVSDGCYAMTDEKIEEIYALVEGALQKKQKYVQVHAFPFRMTDTAMALYSESKWYDFWTNLKEGYDYFEAEKLPPHVKVEEKLYTIHEVNES